MSNFSKLLLLFTLFSQLLFGGVSVKLDRDVVTRGTSTTLIVTIEGKDIDTPNITELAGVRVEGVSRENFFNSINGKVNRGMKVKYRFSPEENSTIEPIRYVVDGEEFWTKRVAVTVIEPTRNATDPFQLEVLVDKKKVYLGETLRLDVKYREDRSKQVMDRRYEEPSGEGFWRKTESQVKERKEGLYNILEVSYFFSPQKSGKIDINSAKMRVGTRAKRRDAWGFFFESVDWHEVISNRISVEVLPSPTKLVGDFDILVEVDKREVEKGGSIDLTLKVSGDGNIEDIEPFGINIKNGVIYDEKPKLNHQIESNGDYRGQFSQKFAIILEKNSSIPPLQIQYFNPQTGKIVTKASEEIEIVVEEPESSFGAVSDRVVVERAGESDEVNSSNVHYRETSKEEILPYLLTSFFSGVAFTLLLLFFPYRRVRKIGKLFQRKREKLKRFLPDVHDSEESFAKARELEEKIYKR
jgi:hypothetical protein